jgi:two-component system OmpR family sensor kinase
MRGRLSIRARLTVAFAAALLLVLALAGAFVYQRVSGNLNSAINDSLHTRASGVAELIASGRPPSRLPASSLGPADEGFTQVVRPPNQVVASSIEGDAGSVLSAAEIRAATQRPRSFGELRVQGVESDPKTFARPIDSPSGRLVVVVGASTDDRDETLAGLRKAFLVGAPLALLLASGLGYLLASRALRPVTAMRRRAREITLERSGERLPLPTADDEVRQLGVTLNAMLARIESLLRRERVFVADASHELRTPLAILRAELELADRPGRSTAELREALGSAREEVDRLSQLAEDLLLIAGSDEEGVRISREQVRLEELLERVRQRFAKRAAEAGRQIDAAAPGGASAALDPLRIEQALGNLVDNALRYGGGAVRLSAEEKDDRIVFEVTDQGDGFPADFEPQAFERFSRAEAGRSSEGTGLGLAIVRAIAEAHGGSATIAATEGGQTAVRLSIAL